VSLVTLVAAIRRPRRATIGAALMFGATTAIVAIGVVTQVLDMQAAPIVTTITSSLLMALPYLLLRLVAGVTNVPSIVQHLAGVGLLLAIVGLFAIPQPLPVPIALVYVAYFVAVEGYAAWLVLRAGAASAGVTRRRLYSIAIGSFCLGLLIICAGLQQAIPAGGDVWGIISQAASLGSGLAYFVGFATPTWVRRAWQEPELRTFLGRAARLPRLPDTAAIVREIEQGAAAALGSGRASVGLWDAAAGVLRFEADGKEYAVVPGEMNVGRVFASQRATFVDDSARANPSAAAVYEEHAARAALIAPITAGSERLGVLIVYAERAPLFAEDDLRLVQLLADQAAVILESRALIDEAMRVRAAAEATRLKEDFLSAAAHDLKTPLTAVVARAQLMRRRLMRQPTPDEAMVRDADTIVTEGQRLSHLVLELLDAQRAERGALVGELELADLVSLARAVQDRLAGEQSLVTLDAPDPVMGAFDVGRIDQLLTNLVENAIKYSPSGEPVVLAVRREGDAARIEVRDRGIGIPPEDLPHLFERFHRGSNVDDRRFPGMGLGLYVCRAIAEGHGGRIVARSKVGEGTTFEVSLPLTLATLRVAS
jgi:signal transduction histidine kinase